MMNPMRQYEMYEIRIPGDEPSGSWVEADITGTFDHNGQSVRIRGFYAGSGIYAVRFLPEEPGTYTVTVTGTALREVFRQTVECERASCGRHGVVRADGTHFRCEDGTWFYPFGTTVYALTHQEDALVEQTFETLSSAPFNKIRICVFPKHYSYNRNEPPCFAFEPAAGVTDPADGAAPGKWDVHHPVPAFWDRLEGHIRQLGELGIQCDLILFHAYDRWGFSRLTRQEALVYLDYAVRRLSAFPNLWWSLANEYDILPYEQEDWEIFAHFIHENDPCGHLLSNHHMAHPWDFANKDTTHICLQTSELQHLNALITKFGKPLMVDECRYEGNIPLNWGNISGFELVNRFWTVVAQGSYCTHGETFLNPEEILWWARGGKLTGESPARIAFLRQIIESLPGPLTCTGRYVTREQFEAVKALPPEQRDADLLLRLLIRYPYDEVQIILNGDSELCSTCGEEAYLKYYARNCTSEGRLQLPADRAYRIEVIDVWEMTRTTVCETACGDVTFSLPGKEGIAVLATCL